MSNININGINPSDGVEGVVSQIDHRSLPEKRIETGEVSYNPGVKLLSDEFTPKRITMKGFLFGTTVSGLQGIIDKYKRNFSRGVVPITVESGRTYFGVQERFELPDSAYNNTYTEYTMSFFCADPFAYGPVQVIPVTVASGITTYSGLLSISGTGFAQPQFKITPTPLSAGNSGIFALKVLNQEEEQSVTVSGVINYNADVLFNYKKFTVTNSGIDSDFLGVFARFYPGYNPFTITVISGINPGYDLEIRYDIRYL